MNSIQNKFYLDSYALIELLRGGEEYEKYQNSKFVLLKTTLSECYYMVLRDHGKKSAQALFTELRNSTIPLQFATIIKAMNFRYEHRKLKFSFTDCLGYATSLELGIPFLTGDKEFQGLPNVEFVR